MKSVSTAFKFQCVVVIFLVLSIATSALSDIKDSFGINVYGSFLHTERVPNALFFFSDIEENDSFELRKAIRNHPIEIVVLSSRGGSVWEGLNMAGIIFDKGLKTYVPRQGLGIDGNCASACSFMFFGGNTRVADGKLGVHQFYSGSPNKSESVAKTQSTAQFTVSEIIGFLNEFVTPPFVFERMFQQKEMYYFTRSELEDIARIEEPITNNELEKIRHFIRDFNLELKKGQSTVASVSVTEKSVNEPAQTPKDKPLLPKPKPSLKQPTITEVKPDEPSKVPNLDPSKTESDERSAESIQKKLVADIQTELNRLNCNAGSADGIIGNKTRNALRRFAEANDETISPSSLTDHSLLKKLKLSNNRCKSVKYDLVCTEPKDQGQTLRSVTIYNYRRPINDGEHVRIEQCFTNGQCITSKYRVRHDEYLSSSADPRLVFTGIDKVKGQASRMQHFYTHSRNMLQAYFPASSWFAREVLVNYKYMYLNKCVKR